MARANKQLKEASYNYGKLAFESGKRCVPVCDQDFLNNVVVDLEMGEGTPYYKAWSNGWMDANLKAQNFTYDEIKEVEQVEEQKQIKEVEEEKEDNKLPYKIKDTEGNIFVFRYYENGHPIYSCCGNSKHIFENDIPKYTVIEKNEPQD